MCYERIKNLRRSSLSILRIKTTAVAAKGEIVERAASIPIPELPSGSRRRLIANGSMMAFQLAGTVRYVEVDSVLRCAGGRANDRPRGGFARSAKRGSRRVDADYER